MTTQADLDPAEGVTPAESMAFNAGLKIGARQERRRILAGLDAAVLTCCFDGGTPEDRARASALAAVRKMVVEGGEK